MGEKKRGDIDAWLARPDPKTAIVLIYGPDRGLVAERARAFATKTGLPLDDPFSVVRMDAAELDRDEGRLIDEARTVPMFSDRRLLWLRNAGTQKGLAEAVKLLCAEPPRDAVLLIEAGELRKGAPLRAAVEQAAAGMAIACYEDEQKDLDSLIDDELFKAGLRIGMEARQLLRRSLGGDRLATRGEIEKLVLYTHGKSEVESADIAALGGDATGLSTDDTLDALLEGKLDAFDQLFSRNATNAGQASTLLSAALRQFQTLHALSAQAGPGGRNAASAVASARPPIFFARKRVFEQALARWSGEGLERALGRIQTAVLATRRRPELGLALVRQALMGLAVESARLAARR